MMSVFTGISFGSLMDIDKLIHIGLDGHADSSFGSLMDIDKLIQVPNSGKRTPCFGSLMDIDKLILDTVPLAKPKVLVL